MNLDYGTLFNLAYGALNSAIGLFPILSPMAFFWWLVCGWLGLGAVLLAYVVALRGDNDAVLGACLNLFWLYMAALTIGFVMTRGTVTNALAWWLICSAVFELLFVNLMAIRDRYIDHSNPWVRWVARVLGAIVLIVGFPIDVIYNLTWGRLMFLQKPRLLGEGESAWERIERGDWTLTATLKRNVFDLGWRGLEARFICRWLIEPYDEGHCGKLPQ